MSNNVNTDLLERVAEAIDNSTSESFIRALERALDDNDLELLHYLIKKGERA